MRWFLRAACSGMMVIGSISQAEVMAPPVESEPAVEPFGSYVQSEFDGYWYSDGAEISRYALSQSRYGEVHEGDAILLYVTEGLRSDIQVKADLPADADLPILKLNAQRKFFTGIYPYSTMTSVFSPVAAASQPLPVKVTTSVQEWCGQVYMQMNLEDEGYRVRAHSYFEREADEDFITDRTYSEDGIFTLIRLAPSKLPIGDFSMIVGTLHSRLKHIPLRPYRASGELLEVSGQSLEGNPLVAYRVEIPSLKRVLTIRFERGFPYRIEGWDESVTSLSVPNKNLLKTTATRTHTIKSFYWSKNGNEDRVLLDQLGLEP